MFNYLQLRDFSQFKSSSGALIAANAIPLFGVLFLDWDAFSIVALYWAENVIIGSINVLKMATCDPDADEINWSEFKDASGMERVVRSRDFAPHGSKLFFIPFFVIHYGLFCAVHGMFLWVIFGRIGGGFGRPGGFDNILNMFSREHLWMGVVGLAASHLWSFVANYLGRGEYRKTLVVLLMFQPYARIMVLHLAILLGGIVAFALGSNILVLIILIGGKTMLDLSLHLREHERIDLKRDDPAILPEIIMGEGDQTPPTPPTAAQRRSRPRSSSGD
jgi:hypothetical protein